MIDLLTIRHSPVDVDGVCYGQIDVPTLMTATEVVDRIEPVVVAQSPGVIWSSDARRCAEPAAELALRLGLSHAVEPRLRELSYGDWEGKAWADLRRADVQAWRAQLVTVGPPGGESFSQLAGRVQQWWKALRAGRHMLVAHAGVMHALDVVATGMTWDETVAVRFDYLEERRFSGRADRS